MYKKRSISNFNIKNKNYIFKKNRLLKNKVRKH